MLTFQGNRGKNNTQVSEIPGVFTGSTQGYSINFLVWLFINVKVNANEMKDISYISY